MTDRSYRLLLVDEQPENYHLINTYLGQLSDTITWIYKLDWIAKFSKEKIAFLSQQYDAYLIDSQFFPSLGRQIQRVSPAPVIILTDNYKLGMIAIQAGAADYLDKTQLTLAALERSLRLTLACSRLQQQNEQLERKIAVSPCKKSKEDRQAIAQQIRQTDYRHLLKSVTLKIYQSLNLDEILRTTVTELGKILKADRVVLFQFLPDGSGKAIEEAVLAGFPAMLGKVIIDESCQEQLSRKYTEGYVHVCSDIERAELSPCHRQFLQQYQIRANLILPIFRRLVTNPNNAAKDNNYLWGLLCVQQCSQPRYWSEEEIELLQQLGGQLNIALSQAELLASEIKQRQELARSNAELEQFAYIASHDLQAPLQTIANYAQLLERRYRGQLDEKADKFINYIVDGVRRMQTQINDLLEYSRFGRQRSTFRDTDCNLVVEQAIANLRSEIEQNEAVITCQDNLPTLIADSSQLVVLFQNLLGNSIKYRSRVQPVIKITAIARENSWQFFIADNGIGIEPKYQQRIFQIFQRLHTREEYPGNGMGLAICQKIVERHGGTIGVESQLNCGATFHFTLPARSS
jgi:signal transduction histidine kinase